MANELYQKENSKNFYEERYEKGYMDEWPHDKKQRVFEIIQDLHLPEFGTALDFGCGNGIFTEVIRQALPLWKVYGCDISKNAIDNAKIRFPECSFFVNNSVEKPNIQFDFLFSHHVLEHVFDIKNIVQEINSFLKPESHMLHIFPCGNANSFEYNVSNMRIDGINTEMENRFFFEDEGHIRRLTSDQANTLMQECGFAIEKELVGGQHYVSLQWISDYGKEFILDFADMSKAINKEAETKLKRIKTKLLLLYRAKVIVNDHTNNSYFKELAYHLKMIVKICIKIIAYPLAKLIVSYINKKEKQEWIQHKTDKNGAEMYLFYKRN